MCTVYTYSMCVARMSQHVRTAGSLVYVRVRVACVSVCVRSCATVYVHVCVTCRFRRRTVENASVYVFNGCNIQLRDKVVLKHKN